MKDLKSWNRKKQKLDEIKNTYNTMINQSDQFYQDQINAIWDYNTNQQDLKNQQIDLIINEINQNINLKKIVLKGKEKLILISQSNQINMKQIQNKEQIQD